MAFVMNDSAQAASPKLLPMKSVPRLGLSSLNGFSWAAPRHAVVVSAIPRASYRQQVTDTRNGLLRSPQVARMSDMSISGTNRFLGHTAHARHERIAFPSTA